MSAPVTDRATSPIPGPRGLANLRGIRQLFSDLAPALDAFHSTYGPICRLGGPGMRIVVIGDPNLIQEIFSTKVDKFRWKHKFNVVGVRFVVGNRSMIVSDGVDHQRRRGAVQKAFTRPRLHSWIPMIVDRSDAAIDQVVDGFGQGPADRPVDLYPVGRELILGITLHAFFGERLAQRVDEFSQLFLRAQAFIEAPGFNQLPHPFPFTSRSRVRADRRRIDKIIDEEVADRRACPTGDPLDILEVLATDDKLSDAEIRDQADTLIGAGYDTTASTFAWLLWCAALEPGVWARLRAEADEVLGTLGEPRRQLEESVLSRLAFAQRVVRESLRLHPAGLIGARVAGDDVRVGDYVIKKGTLIAWSPYLAGRDANTGPIRRRSNRTATWISPTSSVRSTIGHGCHLDAGRICASASHSRRWS